MAVTETNLDYLLDDLRLHLGDFNSASYRYADTWLMTALVGSVKALMRWWNNKYLIDGDNNVARNDDDWDSDDFTFDAPPIVERRDEKPIILMASLIIKGGSLEENAWNTASWRDDEISYSNIQGSKVQTQSFKNDWDALTEIMTPPTKKLVGTQRRSIIN